MEIASVLAGKASDDNQKGREVSQEKKEEESHLLEVYTAA
jgi:hypothetical protein